MSAAATPLFNGTFTDVTDAAGVAGGREFGMGCAIADYDNDGRLDVLIGNNGEPPVLLKNTAGDGNHWVGLKLQGTKRNRDAVGATIHHRRRQRPR